MALVNQDWRIAHGGEGEAGKRGGGREEGRGGGNQQDPVVGGQVNGISGLDKLLSVKCLRQLVSSSNTGGNRNIQ